MDRQLMDAVLRDFGKVDILVNNAGIASRGQPVADTDPAEMERVVRTHAFSAFYLSRLALPSMRQQRRTTLIPPSLDGEGVSLGSGVDGKRGRFP